MDEIYTAKEFAYAFGIDAPQVEKALSETPGQTCIRECRQVQGWCFGALPSSWRANLEKLARLDGCRDLDQLLRNPPILWIPPISEKAIAARSIEKAKIWCDILAPLLTKGIGESAAKIARAARARVADIQMGGDVSDRTFHRVINLARERAGNRFDFNRWQLFLDEAACTPHPTRDGSLEGKDVSEVPPAKMEAKTAFVMAFERYDQLTISGTKSKEAKKQCLEFLTLNSPDTSLEALRKHFERNYPKWKAAGQTRLALNDRRKGAAGRKSKFHLSETEASELRRTVLEKGSFALAIERFAEDELCQLATKKLILQELDRAARSRRKPQWPDSLRKAGHVSEDERALFRGPKHFGSIEFCVRRGAYWIDESGTRYALEAGSIYESDDMSINQPFRYVHPETGRIEIGRQTLCTMDVYSGAWLGGSPIGRSRDAYRVEDIADHMLAVIQQSGLPLIWRLERGVWENQMIDGITLDNGDVWGSLNDLFHVHHTWKSRGKGLVETSFRSLQDHMAHESQEMGRVRGEFEVTTKKLTRLAYLKDENERERVSRDFWDIAAADDGMIKAMSQMNARPRQRRMLGRDLQAPDDLYRSAVFRPCPNDELWRFCPVKKSATVRGGHVEVSAPYYPFPFRFQLNGIKEEVYFDHGHRVLIAFHPGRPEEGCHIFNYETGNRNRDGYRTGEFLLIAAMSEDAPQFNLAPSDREFVARKNANAAVRTEYRGMKRAGKIASATSSIQDGWGNRAEKVNGIDYRNRDTLPLSHAASRKAKGMDMMKAAPKPQISEEELDTLAKEEKRYLESMGIYA